MADRPKHIDVISCNGIDYHKGDLVEVQTIGTFGYKSIGRIDSIDINSFRLDVSKQFTSNIEKFDYEDVLSIKALESEEMVNANSITGQETVN